MNTSPTLRTRLVRPFLALGLFLTALVLLRAENWQPATIYVTPARVNHSFALGGDSTGDPASFFESSGFAATRLLATLDLDQQITLYDWTAGDSLTLDFSAGATVDARGALWNAGSGLPRQYFLLPWTLAGHEFALVHPDGTTYPVTKGGSPTVTAAAGPAFEASALCTPGQEFWLADLQTYARSPSWETYLVATSWAYDPTLRPLEPVTLYLEGREDGHIFTVHSLAAGGAVSVQSVQAQVGVDVGWVNGAGGSSFEVYPGSAALSFPVGRGMEFWVTRDTDPQPIESPHWTADNSAVAPQAWPLYGVYPAVPPPPPQPPEPHTFRIHAQRWGHLFTVWQSDGVHFAFGAANQVESGWPGQFYTTGTITGQDVLNPLGILTFTASIDPTRAWWLSDDTMGQTFPIAQTDVLDGWRPLTTDQSAITLHLGYPSPTGPFQLFAPESSPGAGETPLGEPFSLSDYGAGYTTDDFSGLDGMANYAIGTVHLIIPKPEPEGSGPYILYGVGASVPVYVGDNDLRLACAVAQPLQLMISTSRWDHELLLRHPDGTAYPVVRHQTQGNVSFDPSGNAWQNSYYYFDASTSRLAVMPWYLEDASTGERLGPFQSEDGAFIDWIALAAPKNLAATEQPDGTFLLTWKFAETSTEGGFKFERRESATEPWEELATISAFGNLNTTTGIATAPASVAASQPEKTASIRVSYEFGGRRSAPSNTVVLANADSDGDEIPDWWETANGLNPNNPSDAAAPANPANPGGPTNKDKYKSPDLKTTHTDDDGVADAYDLYPDDGRRYEDVPMIHYAALDFAPAIFGPLHYGWFAAIDDTNKVSILVAEQDAEGKTINYKVATWTLGDALPAAADCRILAADEKRGSYTASYWPAAINATGKVVGTLVIGQSSGFENPNHPPLPSGYPGQGHFAFTWTDADANIATEGYLKYDGVKNGGLVWGSDSGGRFLLGPLKFKTFVSDTVENGPYRFHYDPEPFGAEGNFCIAADGRAYGTRSYRSNPDDLSSAYDLHSRALWTGSTFIYLFGDADDETVVLALGDGGRVLGHSPRFAPTSAPLFSGPKAVPGLHPFLRVGEETSAFQTKIPEKYRRQIAFGPIPPETTAPAMWAVINPQGDLIARAQFLEGKNKLDAKWVDGSLLYDATHPEKFCRTDLGGCPTMMNKNHIVVSGGSILLPVDITVRKKTEAYILPGRVVVKKGEVITFDINGTAPASAFPLPASTVKWKIRPLKQNGTTADWADVPGEGLELDFTTNTSGIFQAKAVVTVSGGEPLEFPLIRKSDVPAPHGTNSNDVYNESLRAGKPDYFGVTDTELQIMILASAHNWLGRTDYSFASNRGMDGEADWTWRNQPKCNLFVFDRCSNVGAVLPTFSTWTSTYPPVAKDDWFNEPAKNVNMIGSGWHQKSYSEMPQPGWIVSSGGGGGVGHGHVGVLDYDGTWISAGTKNVNKSVHLSDESTDYKPPHFRSK